jgi:hypothetical protein
MRCRISFHFLLAQIEQPTISTRDARIRPLIEIATEVGKSGGEEVWARSMGGSLRHCRLFCHGTHHDFKPLPLPRFRRSACPAWVRGRLDGRAVPLAAFNFPHFSVEPCRKDAGAGAIPGGMLTPENTQRSSARKVPTERGGDRAVLKTVLMRAFTILGRQAAQRLPQPDVPPGTLISHSVPARFAPCRSAR